MVLRSVSLDRKVEPRWYHSPVPLFIPVRSTPSTINTNTNLKSRRQKEYRQNLEDKPARAKISKSTRQTARALKNIESALLPENQQLAKTR